MTNLVSGARTKTIKIYFNNKKEYFYIKRKTFYYIKYVNGLFFIQYNEIEDSINQIFTISKILIMELRKFAAYWHKIINYIGPKVVKYLQNATKGIKICRQNPL